MSTPVMCTAGKSMMAKDLAQRFKLRLLEPEVLIAEAIKAAEEWDAAHPAGEWSAVFMPLCECVSPPCL